MTRLTLNQKLWSMLALIWVGLGILVVSSAWSTRSDMLEQRKTMLSQQIDTAVGLIAYYQKKVADKVLAQDEGKRQAIEALRGIRYGADRSGYFGLYDSNVVSLLNPAKPEIEGRSQMGLTDSTGAHLAVNIVKSASAGENHISSYVWPKFPGAEPVPKIAYCDYIPDWNWYVFSGVYVDDIDHAFHKKLWHDLVLAGVVLVALSAGMLLMIRNIRASLGGEPSEAAFVCEQIAKGALAVKVNLRTDDTTSLMASLKTMRDSLSHIVTDVRDTATSVATASEQIAQGTLDLSGRTEEQAASLEQTASSMEELTATVNQNADNAKLATSLANNASVVALRGGEVVGRVVDTMRGISDSASKVGEIINVIEGIAFQTNILALNAAVEAARAGEQGRGFAVVASEVRMLAQRSATAAKEIKALIDESASRVSNGSILVAEAGTTIDEAVLAVRRVTDIMNEISSASEEQRTGIEQINTAVIQMDEMTQRNAALVEQASAAAQTMSQQANGLRSTVEYFSIGGETERKL